MKRKKRVKKKWVMRDGSKIRICDMNDRHLENTIKMVSRSSSVSLHQAVVHADLFLRGEMARETIPYDPWDYDVYYDSEDQSYSVTPEERWLDLLTEERDYRIERGDWHPNIPEGFKK